MLIIGKRTPAMLVVTQQREQPDASCFQTYLLLRYDALALIFLQEQFGLTLSRYESRHD